MMKRYGFTLVELMVVIFIFSIIMAATFTVLSMGRQSWHTGSTQVELQQETRRAMDRMVRELRESASSQVNITGGGGIITFRLPEDADGDDDVLDGTGNIEWGNQITYSLGGANGDQVLRTTSAGSTAILANNINALSFSSISASEISIGITARKDAVPGRTMQSTLNSQVTLRNLP